MMKSKMSLMKTEPANHAQSTQMLHQEAFSAAENHQISQYKNLTSDRIEVFLKNPGMVRVSNFSLLTNSKSWKKFYRGIRSSRSILKSFFSQFSDFQSLDENLTYKMKFDEKNKNII